MHYLETLLVSHPLQPLHLLGLLFIIAFGKSTIAVSSFLPPASVMLVAVIALAAPQTHPLALWLAITLGATLGSVCSYHVGAAIVHYNRFSKLRERYAVTLDKAAWRLAHGGVWVLFVSRFLAVLRYVTPLAAGMLSLKRNLVYSVSLGSAAVWAAMLIAIARGGAQLLPFL
ncbi:DedA family protein [Entomohabitans teleogrylli]|uniref:DedA family protein n=1 Tax=Entomohabitans teleogrylli TaxID=1384589 RepID=UPI00073D558C|nr:VTT domain-containing protein [Entomohabitans teleogrylli]